MAFLYTNKEVSEIKREIKNIITFTIISKRTRYLEINLIKELKGFSGGSDGKESAWNAGDLGSIHGLGRSPGKGNGNPLQYSCLGKSTGWRSLVGYSPWGCKEMDMTERLHFYFWKLYILKYIYIYIYIWIYIYILKTIRNWWKKLMTKINRKIFFVHRLKEYWKKMFILPKLIYRFSVIPSKIVKKKKSKISAPGKLQSFAKRNVQRQKYMEGPIIFRDWKSQCC